MFSIADPLLVIITLIIFTAGMARRARLWMMGAKSPSIDSPFRRIKDFIIYAIGHVKILKEPYPGLIHFFIFFACLIPLAVIAFVQTGFTISEFTSRIISVFLDILGALGLLGVLFAAYRRYIQKPDRLDDTKAEDAVALIWLFAIIFTGFCVEGLRLKITEQTGSQAPVGLLFSYVFAPVSPGFQVALHGAVWRVHFLLVLGLIASIPYTKFLHIITSGINIFLREYGPAARFKGINFETAETYGVSNIEEFTRTQLFNLDACTRCGRCQDNCPTHLSEKPLAPRKLLQDLKAHMLEKAKGDNSRSLIGDVISHDTLWACTTCLNCHAQCPVFETTIDKTIELRRYLVMTEPNFPPQVQTVFKNMENNSNPWGIGSHTRADWAKDLGAKTASDSDGFDILLYAGCASSYDDRYKRAAAAVVKILNKAGVRFAILGTEESCCGDSARRLGNEYLYETLAKANIETMKKYKAEKILTLCPHCFNTLNNDYRDYGATFEVLHHSKFLKELIDKGMIRLKSSKSMKVCYHDSCFLGRYNGIYDEPRAILSSIGGVELVEMDRTGEGSFCCGAGGGRMWMDEDIGIRINEMRAQQAIDKNPDAIATACPYCLTMLGDGLKAKGKSEEIRSLDIAEFILEAME
jgi:Fe-S oxidoreductase/nitrate reductase gamma subunit